jgi:hypothetical protein
MPEYTIKIGLSEKDRILGLLERVQGLKEIPKTALVRFKVNRGIAAGANDYCIVLEPTESLMELVSATRTGEIKRCIS